MEFIPDLLTLYTLAAHVHFLNNFLSGKFIRVEVKETVLMYLEEFMLELSVSWSTKIISAAEKR